MMRNTMKEIDEILRQEFLSGKGFKIHHTAEDALKSQNEDRVEVEDDLSARPMDKPVKV